MTTKPEAATVPATSDAATGLGAEAAPEEKKSRGEFLFFARRSKKFMISAFVLLVLAVIAVFGPIVDPTDPVAQNGVAMRGPTLDPGNWFG
jgi:hypothetical protein